jgi:hypothetical protein
MNRQEKQVIISRVSEIARDMFCEFGKDGKAFEAGYEDILSDNKAGIHFVSTLMARAENALFMFMDESVAKQQHEGYGYSTWFLLCKHCALAAWYALADCWDVKLPMKTGSYVMPE